MIHPLVQFEGVRQIVMSANSMLAEVIIKYTALEMAAKERLSKEASMWTEWPKLRQDCANGTATVNAFSQALARLDIYLSHEALAKGLPARELGYTCSVCSLLWLIFSAYFISIEPVSRVPRHI
jgi:uncharacterized protein